MSFVGRWLFFSAAWKLVAAYGNALARKKTRGTRSRGLESLKKKKEAEKVLENPAAASRHRFVEREGTAARVPPPDRLTFAEG